MIDELELKLQECETALKFYRRRLLSSQSLRSILIDLYNFLENEEAEKKPPASKKNNEGRKT